MCWSQALVLSPLTLLFINLPPLQRSPSELTPCTLRWHNRGGYIQVRTYENSWSFWPLPIQRTWWIIASYLLCLSLSYLRILVRLCGRLDHYLFPFKAAYKPTTPDKDYQHPYLCSYQVFWYQCLDDTQLAGSLLRALTKILDRRFQGLFVSKQCSSMSCSHTKDISTPEIAERPGRWEQDRAMNYNEYWITSRWYFMFLVLYYIAFIKRPWCTTLNS